MIFNRVEYRLGDTREIKRFALFPVPCNVYDYFKDKRINTAPKKVYVWLERYISKEEYIRDYLGYNEIRYWKVLDREYKEYKIE